MHRPLRILALTIALALIGAACGSDDPDSSADEAPAEDAADAPDSGEADSEEAASEEPDSAAGEETAAAEADPTEVEEAEEVAAAPTYGGELLFGLEAETPQGWNPATTQCATACNTVMRAMFDPLFTTRDDGTVTPFLLESAEPNAEYTEWIFTMRPDIEFHDGTPADAVALQTHIGELQKSLLSGKILQDIQSVEVVDDLSVRLTLSAPDALLPQNFGGQLGYLAAPTQYALGEDSATNPIGTGPFVMESWNPNVDLVVSANPDYWRTDHDGNQLPYLEGITFRPIPDTETRAQILEAGDVDVIQNGNALQLEDFQENFEVLVEDEFNQSTFLMLNNAAPPFDDPRVREAVALCTDYETIRALRAGDATTISNGPFGPGTPGHLEDSGIPTYDPDAGRALLAEIGDIGPIDLVTAQDQFNSDTLELIATIWSDCGINVGAIDTPDQGELISTALAGDFQAMLFRLHSGFQLDAERIWWHSDNAEGLISTNFGSIRNPAIDAALDAARRTSDPDELRALAEDINRAFGADVNNIWLYYAKWLHPHDAKVRDLGKYSLPDGSDGLRVLEGRVSLAETWLAE